MPANGRWDLIRRLKVNAIFNLSCFHAVATRVISDVVQVQYCAKLFSQTARTLGHIFTPFYVSSYAERFV